VAVVLISSFAWAQLVSFNADEPAYASAVNGNFNQLKTWLEQKVGTVGSNTITTGQVVIGAATNQTTLTVNATGQLQPTGGLALPEGDVPYEAVLRLVSEKAPDLGAGPIHVVPRKDDRVETGVPEPLEGVGSGRGADEVVVEAAPGGRPLLPVALVKLPDPRGHGVVACRMAHEGPDHGTNPQSSVRRSTPGPGPRSKWVGRFRPILESPGTGPSREAWA